MPSELLSEHLQRQRLTRGDHEAQDRSHDLSIADVVGTLTQKLVLMEHTTETARKLCGIGQGNAALANAGAEALDVEERPFAAIEDLCHEIAGIIALAQRGAERGFQIFADVVTIELGRPLDRQRRQSLKRSRDVELRPARDDETDPVGQQVDVLRQDFGQLVASASLRLRLGHRGR